MAIFNVTWCNEDGRTRCYIGDDLGVKYRLVHVNLHIYICWKSQRIWLTCSVRIYLVLGRRYRITRNRYSSCPQRTANVLVSCSRINWEICNYAIMFHKTKVRLSLQWWFTLYWSFSFVCFVVSWTTCFYWIYSWHKEELTSFPSSSSLGLPRTPYGT